MTTIEMKICATCLAEKPLSEFNIRKDSASKSKLTSACKACKKIYNQKYYYENHDNILEQKSEYYETNKKKCIASVKSAKAKRLEHYNEYATRWRKRKKEYISDFMKKYYKEFKHEFYARNAERRSSLLKATPVWADFDEILKIYRESIRLTKEKGITYSADHIIPLKNPIVCGLHVHINLMIITKADNCKKNNKFDQDAISKEYLVWLKRM